MKTHTLHETETYIGNYPAIGRAQVSADGETELQVVLDERYIDEAGEVSGGINCYYLENIEPEKNLIAAGFSLVGVNYEREDFIYTPMKFYRTDKIRPGIYEIAGNEQKERLIKA